VNRSIAIAAALYSVLLSLPVRAQEAAVQNASGRVVATVTTLDGTVHVPGVQIDLVAASDAIVIATTATDGRGMVTFPDVPAGR
jgi:hypothetical protein